MGFGAGGGGVDSNVRYLISADGAGRVAAQFKGVDTAIGKTGNTMKKNLIPNTRVSNMGLMNMGRIAQDMPFGLMGISNNLTFMAEQMGRAKEQGYSFTSQLKGMGRQLWGVGGLTFAFSAITSALLIWQMQSGKATKQVESLTETLKKHWSEVFRTAEAWRKFTSEVEKLTIKQAIESIATLNKEIADLTPGIWSMVMATVQLGAKGDVGDALDSYVTKLTEAFGQIKILNEEMSKGFGSAGGTGGPATLGVNALAAGVRSLGDEVKTVIDSLQVISRQGGASSFRNRGGGARTQGFLMDNVFQPAKPKLLKDAKKIGDTIFDDWSNVLVSNMNTAWITIFGEANSLFEQLINSMVNMLIGQVFSGLLSFLPGGSIVGGIVSLFSGGASPPGGTNQPIVIEMGGMPLGQLVLEGNRQISQRRLV